MTESQEQTRIARIIRKNVSLDWPDRGHAHAVIVGVDEAVAEILATPSPSSDVGALVERLREEASIYQIQPERGVPFTQAADALERLSSELGAARERIAAMLTWPPGWKALEPEKGGTRELAIERLADAKNIQKPDQPSPMAVVSRSDLLELFHHYWWTQGVAAHYRGAAETPQAHALILERDLAQAYEQRDGVQAELGVMREALKDVKELGDSERRTRGALDDEFGRGVRAARLEAADIASQALQQVGGKR